MLQKRLRIPKCHGQDLAQLNKYKYVKKLSKEIKILKGVRLLSVGLHKAVLQARIIFLGDASGVGGARLNDHLVPA